MKMKAGNGRGHFTHCLKTEVLPPVLFPEIKNDAVTCSREVKLSCASACAAFWVHGDEYRVSHFSLPRLCQCVDLPPFRLCGPSAFPILGHQPNEPHGFLEEKGGCGDGAPPDCDVARPYSDPECGKRGGFKTPPGHPPKKESMQMRK